MSARSCKYECGTQIQWDTAKKVFVEQDGTSHTKDRCESLKQKTGSAAPVAQSVLYSTDPTRELAAAIRELAAAIRSRPA